MTKNQIEFGGSDALALQYIRDRGYCSYSSMKNVRDKEDPKPFVETPYYQFGKELHSRFLEKKKIMTLTDLRENEKLLKICINKLADNTLVCKVMENATCEIDFNEIIMGVKLFGRIDILAPVHIGDLKTTRVTSMKQFVEAMDFLQAALYCRVKKLKDFYYIGISKVSPYDVFVFNARHIQQKWNDANDQLDYLLRYLKTNL